MTSTNPPLPDSNPAIGTAPGPVDPAQPSVQTLPIKFTGTGSEYFRIWIVNLLLILVTLSLYKPWAKARTLRYFSGNTLIDGHPMAFHGDAKKMFRGYLLVGVMVLLYLVAGNISSVAGAIALLILVLVWPALLKSSMQFRLANTSWRGLRFRFTGSVGQAYAAVLPLLIPGAIILGAAGLLDPEDQQPSIWVEAAVLSAMLFMLMAVPWLWWRLKRYQHDHYAYAGLQTQFKATARAFYAVQMKTSGITLGCMVALGVVVGLAYATAGAAAALALGLLPLFVLLAYAVGAAYFTASMQNLVWSQTGNREFRFRSALTFRSMVKLKLKNWLFIALTLGFYWPFAAVATARLKLEAMAVLTRVDPQHLIGQAMVQEGDAAGDAAGDLFGLDIGL